MNELKEFKENQEKVVAFAERFPYFTREILRSGRTGEEGYQIQLSQRYKDMYLQWGINYMVYNNIMNYEGVVDNKELIEIYVNSYALFESKSEGLNLGSIANTEGVFFYDHLNSRFYIETDHLMGFLEVLNDWYNHYKFIAKLDNLEKEKKEMLECIANIEKQIDFVKGKMGEAQ